MAWGLVAAWVVASSVPQAPAADDISFNRDVRPILSDACFYCHGPDPSHREADLRLDEEGAAKEWAIVPGSLDDSELIDRITSDDEDLRMPPVDSGKALTDTQIDLLSRWVQQGAEYEPYWAYAAPIESQTPAVTDPRWPLDAVDHYTSAAMADQGLSPTDDADPATLIRRLSFDLTGLPPDPEQVRRFVNDPTRANYIRQVDRLLASPAFGERMAIYWLDLVRYADTVGYHGDQDHNASPYRDYVIDSFNHNLPLDQFTREQLAGDLLPDATDDQLIASGYNRLLQTSHEGGVQPKEYLAIYAADRVRNLSAVWMGATVGCAQCHDHKYDPYSAADFYSLSAFFADLDESQHFKVGTNSLPTRRPPEIEVLPRWQRERLAAVMAEIDSLQVSIETAEGDEAGAAVAAVRRRIEGLESERKRLEDSRRMTMISKAVAPREVRLLPRGNWLDDSGPVMSPSVPSFLPELEFDGDRADRLDLARWLTDADQGVGGLTSRVFVNRFWYLLFGRGLSSSLADFGGQGEPPTHPELLDRLSIDFVDSGWDIKAMMRRLVLTRTYQLSSIASPEALRRDPYNRWFARQSRYRLSAEMVRDNALQVSGLLVNQVGGASVKPYQPGGYYRHLNFPTRTYAPHVDARQWRRGVYVHWQRQFLHPMLKAMDAPSREECTARRSRSNTPLEALVLLNDPTMVESALVMAADVLAADRREGSSRDDEGRLKGAFVRATSRVPDHDETKVLLRLLAEERLQYSRHAGEAERLIGSAGPIADFEGLDQNELAAWTGVCRAILNLYETVTRN